MICVFPGFEEVLARPSELQSILIKEDFPTFDRPMKAYSGFSGGGQFSSFAQLLIYFAEEIFTKKKLNESDGRKNYFLLPL